MTDEQLVEAYAYPADSNRPWVRVNFVASADGAASVEGRTEGLSTAPDRRVFLLLRELCEVVLVGAGTARAENYGGARRPSRVNGAPPPIAVVTASGRLDPTSRLFTDTAVPPLILTGNACPASARRRLQAAGGEVIVLDGDYVSPHMVIEALAARGLHRVLCEGGPGLFGELLAADAVNELCLTISPILAGGATAASITDGTSGSSRLRLAGVLADEDTLLLRYLLES